MSKSKYIKMKKDDYLQKKLNKEIVIYIINFKKIMINRNLISPYNLAGLAVEIYLTKI